MGFGMEILFVLMLGLLILGPKRLHTMLAHVARAKAEAQECDAWPEISARRRTRCRAWSRQERLLSRISWGL